MSIVVKLNANLRVHEVDNSRIFPIGKTFRAEERSRLPEWLQRELVYFEDTSTCSTLIVSETLKKEVDVKKKDTKEAEEAAGSKEKQEVRVSAAKKSETAPKAKKTAPVKTLKKRKK